MSTLKIHGYSVRYPKGIAKKKFEEIMTYDMSKIRQYLMANDHLTQSYTKMLEVEWKKFVTAIFMNEGKEITITAPLDTFAHAIVLHTTEYKDFCENVLGMYIHHYPTHSEAERVALIPYFKKVTYPLLKRLFGKEGLNPELWNEKQTICNSCGFGCVNEFEKETGLQFA